MHTLIVSAGSRNDSHICWVFLLLCEIRRTLLPSLGSLEVALVGQPLGDLGDTLLDGVLVGLDGDLGVDGLLVGGGDACELLDLTGAGLLVEALGVALLGDLEGHVDKDLDKGQGLVVGVGGLGVQLAGEVTVGPVGRDEGGDGDGGGVSEELGDLFLVSFLFYFPPSRTVFYYLGDTADVLVAVLLGKAKVLVQAEADIVAVEAVGGDAEVEEMLLEGCCDGGLARGGEAGEPDGEAALLAQVVALAAREGRVPGDVAAGRHVVLVVCTWGCVWRRGKMSGEQLT